LWRAVLLSRDLLIGPFLVAVLVVTGMHDGASAAKQVPKEDRIVYYSALVKDHSAAHASIQCIIKFKGKNQV
jgi:hypothetical protein